MDAFDFEHSIDPTHSMLAKDGSDHPLHGIAAELAIEAVRNVGNAMLKVWEGRMPEEDMVALASGYFVHPANDTNNRTKEKIEIWRQKNPMNIWAACDKNAALHRSKHHKHDPAEEMDHSYPPKNLGPNFLKGNKLNQDLWAFVTENHEALYGQEDVFKRDLA